MLLLLKERLARIRPSLVFVSEADAGKTTAKTTNYYQTFRRLEEHGITIESFEAKGSTEFMNYATKLSTTVSTYRSQKAGRLLAN